MSPLLQSLHPTHFALTSVWPVLLVHRFRQAASSLPELLQPKHGSGQGDNWGGEMGWLLHSSQPVPRTPASRCSPWSLLESQCRASPSLPKENMAISEHSTVAIFFVFFHFSFLKPQLKKKQKGKERGILSF
ncbi:Hypothetical predicted protein [Podarcis lilfordi]|uniref:Uncharacterized protein n=1 Tax=Podarcis lilfordi TaxID=74358 RepID=A0AA35PP37_9SAUR|nr:Hypothetical predicted protein [Podarcis lilfordi]